jgi:hypothetical protein
MAYKCPLLKMKKIVFLLMVSMLSAPIYAQRIKKNEIDKFTGAELIQTSNETLYTKQLVIAANVTNMFSFCIRRVNGEYCMPATIVMDDVVKYTEEDGVHFLLDNGEIVALKTNYTGIGGERYGNMGYSFSTSFDLQESDVEKLKNNKVITVRVTYLGGHFDRNLKSNKQQLIAKSLKLFDKL